MVENYKSNPYAFMNGYCGISFNDESEFIALLCTDVKNRLVDEPEKQDFLYILKNLQSDTGFSSSQNLLLDIQALSNSDINVKNFEIGEAIAEVVLESNFKCGFHWNKRRDSKNPEGNQTGADLVGFIEHKGEILFLFGEVKTSSEEKNPPQVLTQKETGMISQLKELYSNHQKRFDLIRYLQTKIALNDNIKKDFQSAIKAYYNPDNNYQLIGVLIRDTEAIENDLK
ncbi:MAG TPA: hypothetical protein PK094_07655, partial [Bacteroidales bacterium]|nr:hypothetical protein [Bacteroidales bacterium]